jgi:hypothetical protein
VLSFLDTWVAGGLGLGGLVLRNSASVLASAFPKFRSHGTGGSGVAPMCSSTCSVCSSLLFVKNQHLLFLTQRHLLSSWADIRSGSFFSVTLECAVTTPISFTILGRVARQMIIPFRTTHPHPLCFVTHAELRSLCLKSDTRLYS